ncbi:WD40 repeat-like protein [Microbotryomycetes sp. JL201]|nr:WD40 repeat-like protein [Microbotryomycetes sp. JL201]
MASPTSGSSLVFDKLLSVPAPTTVRGQSTKLGASIDGRVVSYGAGKVAVLRSLTPGGGGDDNGGSQTQQFTQHTANVTVVKVISPYYAASGDAHGNLKVWDTTGNQSLKLEATPISHITDISSDGEGKRIVVVGQGKQSFGATFSLDTGSSIGEVSGHSKLINAVASKPNRPFRAVTGSDDFSVILLNGVPFKYASTHRRHTRFVQSVDYAPSGALFASAASDGVVNLYDGTSGDDRGALIDPNVAATAASATTESNAHSSSVYAVSFSRDSKQLATSGADAKVKLWDADTKQVVRTWDMGADALLSQQVGNVWAGTNIVSLSFSGDLNVIDPRAAEPAYIMHGHQNPVTAIALDGKSSTFFSGDSAGRVLQTFADNASSTPAKGVHHGGLVVDIVPTDSGVLTSSFDDTVKRLSADAGFDSFSLSAGSQPKGFASVPNSSTSFLATSKDIQVLVSGSKTCSVAQPNSSPTSIACVTDGSRIAVGTEDQNLTIFDSSSTSNLKPLGQIQLRNPATKLCFDRSSNHLVVGLSTGKILLYKFNKTADQIEQSLSLVHSRWSDHTARINSLQFYSTGKGDNEDQNEELLVSGSLDESIRVYNVKKPSFNLVFKNAHKGGVASVVWDCTVKNQLNLVSAGADGCIKRWTIK